MTLPPSAFGSWGVALAAVGVLVTLPLWFFLLYLAAEGFFGS